MHFKKLFKNITDNLSEFKLSIGNEYKQVAKEIGYKFIGSDSSQRQVTKYIYEQIKKILTGNDIVNKEIEAVRSQLLIEFFLNKSNRVYVQYMEIIRDATRELNSYTDKYDNWCEAIKLAIRYFVLTNHDFSDNADKIYSKEFSIARAIKYLRFNNYDVLLNNGKYILTEVEQKKIANSLDVKLKRLGVVGLEFILNHIKQSFDVKTCRYHFRRISTNQLIPWGYLLKLSMKHMAYKKRAVGDKNLFKNIINLASNYMTILDFQEYSQWGSIGQRPDTILKRIQDLVLFDQMYSIPQANYFDLIELTEFIFINIESKQKINIGWEVKDYIKVARTIFSDLGKNTPVAFSLNDIYMRLNNQISSEIIKQILIELSHEIGQINKNYNLPTDAVECDQSFKSLAMISSDLNYLFIDAYMFSFGIYETVANKFRKLGLNESIIGDEIELFIANKFSQSKVSYFSNEEYEISKANQNKFQTTRQMAECDFIIETSTTIIFIEVKKKVLTRKSQCGDIIKITTDLIKSFVDAQIQANWHEIILRNEQKIIFKSGNSIELNGRSIEKISLSMFDYMALHDNSTIQSLKNLINGELISSDPSEQSLLEGVNKAIANLRNQYKTPILKNIYSNNNAFFNCRFFNIFQLIKIINDSSSNEDFKGGIFANRNITTGEKDWFIEYNLWQSLQKQK